MYSYEDRLRAVRRYIKLSKRTQATIRQLGYPTKNALKSWYREYEQGRDVRAGYARLPKYSQDDNERAVRHYLECGRCLAVTIKALGYPSRGVLRAWLQELHPEGCTRVVGRSRDRTPVDKQSAVIALANDATGEIVYTRPDGEARIRDLLANWERFLHDEESLDPLVRMAAAHYQFEAIYPFTDGNGRTGRVLNSLFLAEHGLLPLPILYLGRNIIANKADYYRLLLAVTRDGTWEPWLLYMLRAVEDTAAWTTAKIGAIRKLADHTTEHVRHKPPKIYSRELIGTIFEQPYCRIANLVDAKIAGRYAASRYLKALASAGVLNEQAVGKEKLFVHPKLMNLLTRESNAFDPYQR